jgi:IPT/TIG domain
MSLGKRHIGRRVAGIGVGVALMMLGLAAPAYADSAVTAVAPTSGPEDCVVAITGSGFRTFADSVNVLTFVGPVSGNSDDVDAGDWFSISDTEIWAVVPALAPGTTYTVVLTQPSGTNTAGGTFLSTGLAGGAPGGCAPTITSFTPTCGSAGDVVTITGTNLLSADNLDTNNSGGDVYFQNNTATETLASQPVPDLSEPTSISAIVPTGVADGPIHVFTNVDATPNTPLTVDGVFSAASFLTPPPDCVPVGGTTHARSISFKIKSSGKASGVVKSTEDPAFTDCAAAVPVKIQKKTNSGWKTVGKTTTSDTGSYAKKVKNPKGKQKFRALAPKVSLGDPVTDVCSKAKSATRKV